MAIHHTEAALPFKFEILIFFSDYVEATELLTQRKSTAIGCEARFNGEN